MLAPFTPETHQNFLCCIIGVCWTYTVDGSPTGIGQYELLGGVN